MKIAIPRYGEEIAPCFDVATHFVIYRKEDDKSVLGENFVCSSPKGVDRVRKLLGEGVDVLICGGINNRYKYMLQMEGVTVISRITGQVEGALKAFLNGELYGPDEEPIFQVMSENPPLADLVAWTMELFSENGYMVFPGSDHASFPVDLVAEMSCPVCGKPIRAAICCGMHAYRIDEEIRAFHHATGESFNSVIYIHSLSPEVEKLCVEFGIQLIDPDLYSDKISLSGEPWQIPLLKPPLLGHNRLFSN